MILSIIILLVGLLILGGGLYYLVKAPADQESRRIYGITAAVGAVIVIAAVVKMFILA
ncbi:MAG: hypothetical protein Q4C45_04440 [Oscillospiraceae bacterium]|nr:hypothetical protein [Oscillospiraceae bacterium]